MLSRIAIVGRVSRRLARGRDVRARGFDGELLLIGDEPPRPYDRPPLSKQVLQGTTEPEQTFYRNKCTATMSSRSTCALASSASSVDHRAGRVVLPMARSPIRPADYPTARAPGCFPAVAPRAGLLCARLD